jgi:hypothetical protein
MDGVVADDVAAPHRLAHELAGAFVAFAGEADAVDEEDRLDPVLVQGVEHLGSGIEPRAVIEGKKDLVGAGQRRRDMCRLGWFLPRRSTATLPVLLPNWLHGGLRLGQRDELKQTEGDGDDDAVVHGLCYFASSTAICGTWR